MIFTKVMRLMGLIPVRKNLGVVEGTGGKVLRLFNRTRFVRTEAKGALQPIEDVVIASRNLLTEAITLTIDGKHSVMFTPVNKVDFAGAEFINKPGVCFGHRLPGGLDKAEYTVTKTSGIHFVLSRGWGIVLPCGTWVGAGVADWERTFENNKTITENHVTLNIKDAKADKDGWVNLDPNITIGTLRTHRAAVGNWATTRAEATSGNNTEDLLMTSDGTGSFEIDRGLLSFNTAGITGVKKVTLHLTKTGGLADGYIIGNCDFAGSLTTTSHFGQILTKFGIAANKWGQLVVDGTNYSLDITEGFSADAIFDLAIMLGSDYTNTAPGGSENLDFTSSGENAPYLEIELTAAWKIGWGSRREYKINRNKMGSNQTDFPIWLPIVDDSDIGVSALANGHDLRVCGEDGTTDWPYERPVFAIVDGVANGELHAKCPLAKGVGVADTNFYLYWDNAGASDGEDAEAVWDANFIGSYHCQDADAAATIVDSTSNNNDLTNDGTETSTSGKILSARDFVAANTDYLVLIGAGSMTSFTVSAWVKFDDISVDRTIFLSSGGVPWDFRYNLSDNALRLYSANGAEIGTPGAISSDTFYHIAFTSDGTTAKWYINGVLDGSDDISGTPINITNLTMGFDVGRYFDGLMDEIRISDSVRSADWLAAQVANQNDPGSFFTTGASSSRAAMMASFTVPTVSKLSIIEAPFV